SARRLWAGADRRPDRGRTQRWSRSRRWAVLEHTDILSCRYHLSTFWHAFRDHGDGGHPPACPPSPGGSGRCVLLYLRLGQGPCCGVSATEAECERRSLGTSYLHLADGLCVER